ncbi:ABC transporter permease [Actinomadura algeriensis]|uniref:ABC transport system permease protein n=1 Tax=Actinomadura algeriensis TaxID=1679523 RepID=A0ABR9JKY8_9ACTN|nr:FtsX-like permease family protein [Actinomadura algeriensis]MBE1531219.1 putative ABC transport system permease protein [Actinomadura algeriensis]
MIGISLRTLRFHAAGFLASFVAMFLGAVIVIGCGGLLESGIHRAAPPQRLGAAPIVVTGDQRYHGTASDEVFAERVPVDAGLAGELASVPGVTGVAADVSFPVRLTRGGRELTGHGWSSARLGPVALAEGAPPSGDGQVVLPAGLGVRPGETVELLVGGGAARYRVSGLADGPGGAFLTDAEAGRVTGRPGKVDSIGVFTAPGTDAAAVRRGVAAVVDGRQIAVLTGDERGRAENPGVMSEGEDLIALAAAFGGLSAMVTVFGVAATLGLSIRRRWRETALLRAVGATPGQVRRLIVGETMLLAVLATGLACLPGPRVGRWLLAAFAEAGVVPDTLAYRAGSVPLIAGAGTALLTALGAAYVAAHGAVRTRPVEALAEASVESRRFGKIRIALGLGFVAGGAALALGTARSDAPDAAGVATPAAMVWTAGFALLGPVLATVVTAALRRPVRAVTGYAGHLATENARARTARLTGAVLPVMLAAGLALALIYMQTTQTKGAREMFEDGLRADLAVTSAAGGLPPAMVGEIARHPGVAAASAQVTSIGFIEPAELAGPLVHEGDGGEGAPQPPVMSLLGVTAAAVDRTTAFRATGGSLDALDGATVALPERYAGPYEIGDTVPMRLGDGSRAALELVATVDSPPGYETALLPAERLLPHTDGGLVPQILVSAEPGADRARLAGALAESHPGLRVVDRATLSELRAEQDGTQAWMSWLVLAVVVGYAVIALVNAQIVATGERRREFGLLRLAGAARRQVLRMMAVEAALVTAVGVAAGLLVAAVTLVPLSLSVLDVPVPDGSPWILVAVIAAALGLTLAATLLPTLALLRDRPGAAVAGERG